MILQITSDHIFNKGDTYIAGSVQGQPIRNAALRDSGTKTIRMSDNPVGHDPPVASTSYPEPCLINEIKFSEHIVHSLQ
ncbi:hypothetical protein D3C73_800250 [compost metagenome]